MNKYSKIIEVKGHLIDSLVLTKIFDSVMDLEGKFEVMKISVGKLKTDESYAKLKIIGKNNAHLNEIITALHREGATTKTQKNCKTKTATRNMVFPDKFYSTTNNHTSIYHNNKWINVDNMMMDKCIIVKGNKATCVPIREVRKGDKVLIGEDGIKVSTPERPREGMNVFQFMGSGSSSERPTQHIARKVAEDIMKTKKQGGKIILVGGPAIVHTGADDAVAMMIKTGHINAVLAGNALAVHDVEYATLGTSLGMRVKDGTLAVRGHRNHMDAINSVFKAGSLKKMVQQKKLTRGIMYECIKKKIPFVLAGSLRDDGPLPDVITDIAESQREYKKVLKGASMVIMVSTMLHSIATGNMLPANVKVIVIDINQPTVTKLMDRGTWQALGIVTDVGAFLPMVANQIRGKK
jgi:lysine-ketoglutarate reductase/saccharopine dehydrogenase-like protein (TIGR00300 family)|tara:strand:+ start:531 stop:1754 length:1224 start_codon:yes stop_codon:yes gene_type:complete